MNKLLTATINKINASSTPEELFGFDVRYEADLTNRANDLLRIIFPDLVPAEDQAAANEATQKVLEFRDTGIIRIQKGSYGDPRALNDPIILVLDGKQIIINTSGTVTGLGIYLFGNYEDGKSVSLRLSNNQALNKYADIDFANLNDISTKLDRKGNTNRLPIVGDFITEIELDQQHLSCSLQTILPRQGMTVAELVEHFKAKKEYLKLEHVAWITNRIIEGLVELEQVNYVHNAVTPDHVMLDVNTHAGCLLEFGYSGKSQDTAPGYQKSRKSFYAQDFFNTRKGTYQTDLYMLGKCIDYMLDGRTDVPSNITGLVASLTSHVNWRPSSALNIYHIAKNIWKANFGSPKFTLLQL